MSGSPLFTYRMERTSGQSQDLIYEEPGHRLVVYLELAGDPEVDLVGVDTAFLT